MPTINGSVSNKPDKMKFWIEYSYSQNVANNTTTITAISYLNLSYWAFSGSATRSVTIDGTVSSSSASLSCDNNTTSSKTFEIHRIVKTVNHNANGTKSVTISAALNCTSGGYGPGICSASATVSLPTIPRASSVTVSNANIGMVSNITISRASGTFTHKLYYSCTGVPKTLIASGIATSHAWTVPTSIYAKIPTTNSLAITIYCETYNGSSLVGEKTTSMTAYVANSNPTVSMSVYDSNPITVALTGNNQKYIKYMSNATYSATATPNNGASITSVKINNGSSRVATTTTGTFTAITDSSFWASATDSRGNVGLSSATQYPMVQYFKPVFTKATIYRDNTTSPNVNFDYTIDWFNGSFGVVNNTASLKWRWREQGGVWSVYANLTPTIIGNKASGIVQLGTIFDFKKEYEFEFVFADKLATISSLLPLSKGIPIIDIGKEDVAISRKVILDLETTSTMQCKYNGKTAYTFNIDTGGTLSIANYDGNGTWVSNLLMQPNGILSWTNSEGNYRIPTIRYGSWTPNLVGITPASWYNRWGKYIKLDNMVIVQFLIYPKMSATSSNRIIVSGLPYKPKETNFNGMVSSASGIATAITDLTFGLFGDGTFGFTKRNTASQYGSDLTYADTIWSGFAIQGVLIYEI